MSLQGNSILVSITTSSFLYVQHVFLFCVTFIEINYCNGLRVSRSDIQYNNSNHDQLRAQTKNMLEIMYDQTNFYVSAG